MYVHMHVSIYLSIDKQNLVGFRTFRNILINIIIANISQVEIICLNFDMILIFFHLFGRIISSDHINWQMNKHALIHLGIPS